jgi:acetyl esterase/lipase
VKTYAFAGTALLVWSLSAGALAQVPPDIAAAIRKIGGVVDVPNTTKLYAPLFQNQKEPYPDVKVARDIAYGPDPLNKFDIFTPSGGQNAGRTVVIYVHGGGFERGDKRQNGAPFYDNLMLWVTKQGMVGLNMDYRLAPKNHWPDAHEDMASVISWVKANIAQYGGDPNRIVLWGESAGASLIAGYLAHPQFYGPGGHGVKGAILNSGFYDNGEAGSNYFGKNPKELAERSSVEGMKTLNIPLLISHTEVDLPDAIVQADAVNKALCGAGHCPTYVVLKDHSHVSQNYAIGTADVSLSGPVLQFIGKIK